MEVIFKQCDIRKSYRTKVNKKYIFLLRVA